MTGSGRLVLMWDSTWSLSSREDPPGGSFPVGRTHLWAHCPLCKLSTLLWKALYFTHWLSPTLPCSSAARGICKWNCLVASLNVPFMELWVHFRVLPFWLQNMGYKPPLLYTPIPHTWLTVLQTGKTPFPCWNFTSICFAWKGGSWILFYDLVLYSHHVLSRISCILNTMHTLRGHG